MAKLTWIAMIMALSIQMALTQTITFYFDASQGNDANDGSTTAKAYKTFATGVQKSVSRINSGTYALIIYNFASGTYNVALTGSPQITFSSSSPIAFNATSGTPTIAGTGTGSLQLVGGFKNFTFSGFTFSNIISDATAMQFITPDVDVTFTRCTFNNVAGVSALGNIQVTSPTINGVGVPSSAIAFKNSDSSKTITINGGTISNFNGTIVNSLGLMTISSVTFNSVFGLLNAPPNADSSSIRLTSVTANNLQNAILITSSKAVNVQISNSKFTGGAYIAQINIANTASLAVTSSSVAGYNVSSAFSLIGATGKPIVANFTSTNFTNNYSSEEATIFAQKCTVGIKNCVFINNTAVIAPSVVVGEVSVYSSPIYVQDSKVQVISTSFTGNAASAYDQSLGAFGGALTCSGSSVDFASVTFNSNGQSDLLCDGTCNSTGQVTNICNMCVRQNNGACIVPITSSAVTSGKLPDFTTGSPTTAAVTSGKKLTTAAFRPTTTGSGGDNVNNANIIAVSALLLMIALLMV